MDKIDENFQLENINFTRSNKITDNISKKLIEVSKLDVNDKKILNESSSISNSKDSIDLANKKSQIEYENYILEQSSKNMRVIFLILCIFYK